MTRITAARNKERGKSDERRAAEIVGTARYPADTGGAIDLIPWAGHYAQVKGGLRVVSEFQKRALDGARAVAAADPAGIGTLILIDRSGSALREFVMFDLREWASFHGFGGASAEPILTAVERALLHRCSCTECGDSIAEALTTYRGGTSR